MSLLATPWIAGLQINVVLVLTHLPPVVDTLRSNQAGSFVLDAAWMVSALVAWLPVASPRTEDRIDSPIYTCVYLFLAFQVFPMLPGSLITFASLPVYRVYELAPRIGTWTRGQRPAAGRRPHGHRLHAGGVGPHRRHLHPGQRRQRPGRRHDVFDTATGLWLRADGTTATTVRHAPMACHGRGLAARRTARRTARPTARLIRPSGRERWVSSR